MFDRHGGHVFGLAMCMVRDQSDAEMVVVRAFEDVCAQLPPFSSADHVREWRVATVKAHAIAIIRERASHDC
ncbi:MAG TPA: hypothetical protein VE869_14320 [Gemmatimonas sp.]|nr:hypothetical protein [Gemmatimonas sp.]